MKLATKLMVDIADYVVPSWVTTLMIALDVQKYVVMDYFSSLPAMMEIRFQEMVVMVSVRLRRVGHAHRNPVYVY